MHRILSLVLLLPTSVLTVFCFIAYANVVDTMSMKMGSFFMYQVFFWTACGGAALLFIGQVLCLFAARWMLVASLSICAGFTLFSIAAYPAGYDDPRAACTITFPPRTSCHVGHDGLAADARRVRAAHAGMLNEIALTFRFVFLFRFAATPQRIE